MKATRKYYLLILFCHLFFLYPVLCFAQAGTADSAVWHTGFISITATALITVESPEKKLRDSLQWQQQDLLLKKYAGKRIKQILYQRSTDRVVVFLQGYDNVLMDKATAIKEGLLKPDPVNRPAERRTYLPARVHDIYLDSPVYIGIKNIVSIYQPDADDLVIDQPGVSVTGTGNKHEYAITASTPGTATFIFTDSATKTKKYLCHVRVKRLPADDLVTEPEIRLGNIKTLTADPEFLKQQAEMVVGNGFSIAGGRVYFAGTGFKAVVVVSLDQKITYMKPYIDLCMPGSQIVFDNVTVKDPAGKVFSVAGFSINVVDSSSSSYNQEEYYSQTVYPEFIDGDKGLKYFVRQQLAATDIAMAGDKKVAIIFKVEADGSVATISNQELTMMSKFERICFDIIKNGPKWTAGKFKGRETAMIVTYSDSFY